MLANSQAEKEIVEALKCGSKEAFLVLYECYWYKVFSMAYKRLKSKTVAEELTQDLFLKLWEKRGDLKIEKIESYLLTSIKNAVIDHINSGLVVSKYVNYYSAFVKLNNESTNAMVAFDELNEAIEKGLGKLSAKSQQVFKLSRFDKWSSKEIGDHLNLSEKTVGYHLTKSLKFMRSYLREYTLLLLLLLN